MKRSHLRQIAEQVLRQYPFSSKIRFYKEQDHVLFLVYAEHQGLRKRYVLKLRHRDSAPRHDDKLLFDWVRHLSVHAPVPVTIPPVSNLQGEDFTSVAEFAEYVGVVYPWIEGRLLSARLSLPNVRRWGRLLASIHRASKTFTQPAPVIRRWNTVYYWEPRVLYEDTFKSLFSKKGHSLFLRTEDRVQKCLDRLSAGSGTGSHLIHGDLHPGNVKVNKTLYALDFDDFMRGYPIQDIAISLLYVRHRKNFSAIYQHFKAGYTSLQPWPEDDALETLFMGRLLWMINARCSYEDLSDPDTLKDLKATVARYEQEFEAFHRSL